MSPIPTTTSSIHVKACLKEKNPLVAVTPSMVSESTRLPQRLQSRKKTGSSRFNRSFSPASRRQVWGPGRAVLAEDIGWQARQPMAGLHEVDGHEREGVGRQIPLRCSGHIRLGWGKENFKAPFFQPKSITAEGNSPEMATKGEV